jgi:hypothetical protein
LCMYFERTTSMEERTYTRLVASVVEEITFLSHRPLLRRCFQLLLRCQVHFHR